MAASDKTATWSLNLESNAGAISKASAAEVEEFRSKIETSTVALREMSASLKRLRGTSDEVTQAREQLKTKIDAERGAVSKANLELLKNKTNYDALTAAMKKETEAKKKATEAAKDLAKPITEAIGKVESMGEALTTSTGLMSAGALGAIALGGGIAYLGVKVLEATYDLGKFAVVNADAARSMGLNREAASGSAKNSKAMGEQIDALARKIPTSTEELNKLFTAEVKLMSGGTSRHSGQSIVDTFNAVAEAASAAGDETGKAVEEILTRNQRMGRVQLNPFEFQGKWNTGYEDIAKSVAKNMGVTVNAAKLALTQGRVSLDAGAKAIRDAVESRFGEINAKKLLSLDSISTKLHDDWMNLTKGVNLEPILTGFKKIADLFDQTTVEGQELKNIFSDFGDEIGAGVQAGVPFVKTLVEEVILAAQDLELEFYENKKAIKAAFGDPS